jgi:hypothetical protein
VHVLPVVGGCGWLLPLVEDGLKQGHGSVIAYRCEERLVGSLVEVKLRRESPSCIEPGLGRGLRERLRGQADCARDGKRRNADAQSAVHELLLSWLGVIG